MVSTRMAVLGLFVLTGSGCAATPGVQGGPLASATAGPSVLVENQSANNIRISAVYGNDEMTLGRVGALESRTFRLPQGVTGTFRLMARPGAIRGVSQPHVSEPFEVHADARITWELRMSPGTSDLPRLSTIRVFSCAGDPRC